MLPVKQFLEEKNHVLRVFKENLEKMSLGNLDDIFSCCNFRSLHENFGEYEEIFNISIKQIKNLESDIFFSRVFHILKVFLAFQRNEAIQNTIKIMINVF